MIIGICLTCFMIGITIYIFRKGIKEYFKGHSKKDEKKDKSESLELKQLNHGEGQIEKLSDEYKSVKARLNTFKDAKNNYQTAKDRLQKQIDALDPTKSDDPLLNPKSDYDRRMKDVNKSIDDSMAKIQSVSNEKLKIRNALEDECSRLSEKNISNNVCKSLSSSSSD